MTLLLTLAGCTRDPSPTPANGTNGNVAVFDVDVRGRTVTCVSWKAGYAGGLSCDWASAQPTSQR